MTSDLCPSPHKQPPDFLWTSDGAQKGQSSIDTASDFFVYSVYFVVNRDGFAAVGVRFGIMSANES